MQFKYQVLDRTKHMLQGQIEADTAKQARLSLLQQGYDVLLLQSFEQKFQKFRIESIGLVSLKEKMLFVKHLSLMIKSGMLLDESLEALYSQAKGRMKTVLRRLLELVRKGNLLSDGLQAFPYTFNEFFVNMVRVGEQSGSLETNLLNLSVKLKKDHDLHSKVHSAMMYPSIVLIALLGLGTILSGFILPKFIFLFKSLRVELPLITRIFITVAEFSQQYWYLVLFVSISMIVAIIVMSRVPKTQPLIHWVDLHLPIIHIFALYSNLANLCRSMQLMLKGGVPIDASLDIMTRAMSNAIYRRRVGIALTEVRKGVPLSQALSRYPHLFPPIVTKMIHVGEISGNLSDTFEYLAEFYEDELDALSKNLSTVLEPVLLIGIGMAVAFMMLSIIQPLGSILGGISAR